MKIRPAHSGLMTAVAIATMQACVFAQNIEDKTLGGGGSGGGSGGGGFIDTLRMLGAMAIVAALLWVAYKVLMRMGRHNCRIAGGEGKLKVLGVKALSVKHSAVLLQAGRKVFLVGISPAGMSPLGELSGDDAEDITGRKEAEK